MTSVSFQASRLTRSFRLQESDLIFGMMIRIIFIGLAIVVIVGIIAIIEAITVVVLFLGIVIGQAVPIRIMFEF